MKIENGRYCARDFVQWYTFVWFTSVVLFTNCDNQFPNMPWQKKNQTQSESVNIFITQRSHQSPAHAYKYKTKERIIPMVYKPNDFLILISLEKFCSKNIVLPWIMICDHWSVCLQRSCQLIKFYWIKSFIIYQKVRFYISWNNP